MIHHIHLRTSVQATEDPEKVKSALRLFLPPPDDAKNEQDVIHETRTSGYYGNPIIIMEAQLKKKKECLYLTDFIKLHLGDEELSVILEELPLRVDDDCNLFLRFNKQEASKGRLTITKASDAVLIRIKLKAFPAKQEEAIRVAQTLLTKED